jgi:hypothetical protein
MIILCIDVKVWLLTHVQVGGNKYTLTVNVFKKSAATAKLV